MFCVRAITCVCALALAGCAAGPMPCGDGTHDPGMDPGPGPGPDPDPTPGGGSPDAIEYRPLDGHPGCTVEGLAYSAASIGDYRCAAKAYPVDGEDTGLPIVLLMHGNSDTPDIWESHSSTTCDPRGRTQGMDMLAERLSTAGFRVYAIDLRMDQVDDPGANNDTENAARNMDHGWAVPIAQHFIESVLDAHPDRQISLVGHSFGVTYTRDALRRLQNEGVAVWERIDDLVFLAGANHGVSTFRLCNTNPTMRGNVTCEMGDRAAYSPTPFLAALNGPDGEWETPCGDGSSAYGEDACNGHYVTYSTIVMQDLPGGTQQDEFVSEASSKLRGAENLTIGLNDYDESDYFFCGFLKNHFGPARAVGALELIVSRLSD